MRRRISWQILLCLFLSLFIPGLFAQEPPNTLSLSQPSIANSQIGFTVPQEAHADLAIEISTNLLDWAQTEFHPAASNSNSVTIRRPLELTNIATFYRATAQPIFAPLSLTELYVVFTNSDFGAPWYFAPDATVYEMFYREENALASYFQPARTNNSWSVWILYAGDGPPTRLRLDFATADSGTFNYQYSPNVTAYAGDFLTGPLPVFTVIAPQHLAKIRLLTDATSVIGSSDYTAIFSGNYFTIESQSFDGSGSFAYQPQPDSPYATLFMRYEGELTGDFDNVTLDFDRMTFMGEQRVGPNYGSMSGTFTFTE